MKHRDDLPRANQDDDNERTIEAGADRLSMLLGTQQNAGKRGRQKETRAQIKAGLDHRSGRGLNVSMLGHPAIARKL